jgi:hypothetical protein
VSSGTALDAELLLWLRQHRGRWAVFSAAFHHAERAPGDQQPDGRVAHNQKLQNIFGVDTGVVPVMMREGGGDRSPGGSGASEAEMERECPLPPIRTVTTTTDPVVKVSWDRGNHVFMSGKAVKMVKRKIK